MQVEAIKERLLANNEQTYWVPAYVKEKRFHNWLEGAHDWAISRSRWAADMDITCWLPEKGLTHHWVVSRACHEQPRSWWPELR
jgi:isoleucyl-tRNA synthetase